MVLTLCRTHFTPITRVLIERGEIMRIASLAMYVSPPPLAAATATLWAFLRDDLRREGLTDVPDRLDAAPHHADAWLHPALLLAQTCGYPYVRHQRGKVRLVATPVYGHPGCDGADMCSFIIVRADGPVCSLEDLRATRAAINDPVSNSGANLLRATIAPPQPKWPVLLICCRNRQPSGEHRCGCNRQCRRGRDRLRDLWQHAKV